MNGKVAIYCLDQDIVTTSSMGIYRYTQQFIQALARKDNPGFHVVLLLSEANETDLRPDRLPNWIETSVADRSYGSGLQRIYADHILSVRLAKRVGAAVIHFPKGWIPAGRPSMRMIATLHDTMVFYYNERYPSYSPFAKRYYFKWLTLHTLRWAHHITTISHFSRGQLVSLVPTAAARISVTYCGPTALDSQLPASETRRGLLVMGWRHSPHKATRQTLGLIDTYAHRKGIKNMKVTVTGLSEWPIVWGPPPRNIDARYVGHVPDSELHKLLAKSEALVYLSEFEGFGLPVVEAYLTGTPVCYRAVGAVAEVLDGAPGGWDGETVDSFINALSVVLELAQEEIRAINDSLISRFSWDSVADTLLDVYRTELSSVAD